MSDKCPISIKDSELRTERYIRFYFNVL